MRKMVPQGLEAESKCEAGGAARCLDWMSVIVAMYGVGGHNVIDGMTAI